MIPRRAFGRPTILRTFVPNGDGLDAIKPTQELSQGGFLEPGRYSSHPVAFELAQFLVSGTALGFFLGTLQSILQMEAVAKCN